MSSSTTPPDPYGTGDEPDRSSGSTPPPPPYGGDSSQGYGSTPPPYGSTPAYGSTPPAYGSTPPAYGSTPPAYGSTPPAYGDASSYGSTPPAYGADYGQGQPGYGYAYPKNSLGVWSLVLGLVGVFLCGLFTGIPAIIVGHKARGAVADGQANNPGLATAGIVLGWIATILSLLGFLLVVVLIGTGTMTELEGIDQNSF